MRIRHSWWRGFLLTLALSPLGLLLAPPAAPAALGEQVKVIRAQAEQLETVGDWGGAAEKYDQLLRLDRNQPTVRERYQHCLRRFFQVVRLRDPSYHKEVLTLQYPQAMRLYEIVLYNLLHNSLDRDKISASVLFRNGLDEYLLALSSPEFCYDHLGGLKPERTAHMRNKLQARYAARKTMTYEEAVDTVRDVVMASTRDFPSINPTTVTMEFLCGACQAMDDYTVYLTPRQLRELCATLKGRQVGVGLRIKLQDNTIVVADWRPDSPAAEVMPPLGRDDHIVGIDKKSTRGMSPEVAAELLEGEEGTSVELVIVSPGQAPRIVTLVRRALFVPSVRHDVLGSIGYLKIHCFQESTLDEFDAKLAALVQADCKALILDLRGNPGGLLDVSIEIARRFLPAGIIVSTQHHDSKASKVYRADNPMALTLPLVVLVDGDTASAAEVLAGALKENRRATLVGQTTFGKGCSQGLLKLPAEGELRVPAVSSEAGGTGGIRITIARFFSPTGRPYSGRGVEPDVPAESLSQLDQGNVEALRLLGMREKPKAQTTNNTNLTNQGKT